jgi:hypothetical protein
MLVMMVMRLVQLKPKPKMRRKVSLKARMRHNRDLSRLVLLLFPCRTQSRLLLETPFLLLHSFLVLVLVSTP